MSIIAKLKKQIHELQDKIVDIQDECNHPLIARTSKRLDPDFNRRVYFEHTCELCELEWKTEEKDNDRQPDKSLRSRLNIMKKEATA